MNKKNPLTPFKFNIGEKVSNKVIVDRFVGKNAFEKYTNIYMCQPLDGKDPKHTIIRYTENAIANKLTY